MHVSNPNAPRAEFSRPSSPDSVRNFPSPMPELGDRFVGNIRWLIKLRWIAVFGQLLTITAVIVVLKIDLPMPGALLTVLGLTAASNAVLSGWIRSHAASKRPEPDYPNLIPGVVLVMDMLSLTALLFGSGGPSNPFVTFFLVNVSLGAILLQRQWSWGLTLLAVACFLLLVYNHATIVPLTISPDLLPVRETSSISLLQAGLIVSFVLCCAVMTYFGTRITDELRQQEAGLRQVQQLQASSEKLEALGTLAAGTAHELATPLSTIAVVARDVEKFFETHPLDDPNALEVIDDIRLIRSQLDRCRSILNRMAGQAGQAVGETIQTMTIADLWDLVLEDLAPEVESQNLVQVDLPAELADEELRVPSIVLSQALRGLVQNALDASQPGQPVQVTIRGYQTHWHWLVTDHGSGIPPEVLKRISEPFFSTKPVGKGMGLGVFLARNVIERLGGNIDLSSIPGVGTQVAVRLPRHSPEAPQR